MKFPPYNRRRNCSISGTWSASAEWGLITGTWFPPRYIRVMAIRTCAFFGLLRSGTQTAPVAVGVGPRFPPYRDGWWNRATSSIGRSNGARSSRMATSLTSPFGFAASSPDSAKQVGGNQTAILARTLKRPDAPSHQRVTDRGWTDLRVMMNFAPNTNSRRGAPKAPFRSRMKTPSKPFAPSWKGGRRMMFSTHPKALTPILITSLCTAPANWAQTPNQTTRISAAPRLPLSINSE